MTLKITLDVNIKQLQNSLYSVNDTEHYRKIALLLFTDFFWNVFVDVCRYLITLCAYSQILYTTSCEETIVTNNSCGGIGNPQTIKASEFSKLSSGLFIYFSKQRVGGANHKCFPCRVVYTCTCCITDRKIWE